jgi:hypothetical protein
MKGVYYMKRVAVILALILAIGCVLPVWAEGEPAADKSAANAGALLEAWTQERLAAIDQNDPKQMSEAYTYPYPDCINGVWSTDGTMDKLTFAYVQGRKAEAEAELACIEEQSSVTLVEGGKYTIKELLEVQYSLADYIGAESGVAGYGIDQKRNCVRVDLVVNEPASGDTEKTLAMTFGDKVGFNDTDGYAVPAMGTFEPVAEQASADEAAKCGTPGVPTYLLIIIVAAAAALCVLVYFAVRKNKE